ncbi:class I SAM-dependent methyltransferase [Nocardia asiatica]|uniref:class I SAM-dependent methyltransferase n=1 Tax=Nocardia asiatica TaxID=209252 RepID=UPI0002EDC884|nr:class I SAM-dependent methyltransferase [Nocardia asiatica]
MTRPADFWNTVYDNDTAPWVIGEPQPAVVALEREGAITGRVLDPGCGAGEHTILLTRLGYDVRGIDMSPSAVAYARANAAEQGVPGAAFEVADALTLGDQPDLAGDPPGSAPAFDTIVDSALFHVFGTEDEARAAYVRNLHAVCKPGGTVHVLALSDVEPGFGPRISDTLIRESFRDGWTVEDLRPARYRGRITDPVAQDAENLEVSESGKVDLAAWLARIRRL